MSGRTFYENPNTYEAPPTVAERADDALYANAVNALAAVFRMDIEYGSTLYTGDADRFAAVLVRVSRLIKDGWGASDAVFIKDVFEQYGPGAVLLALKRAYELPQPSAPLVGD
jgi:hypothetical protein